MLFFFSGVCWIQSEQVRIQKVKKTLDFYGSGISAIVTRRIDMLN